MATQDGLQEILQVIFPLDSNVSTKETCEKENVLQYIRKEVITKEGELLFKVFLY